jgi:hypothetical protein
MTKPQKALKHYSQVRREAALGQLRVEVALLEAELRVLSDLAGPKLADVLDPRD